MVHDRIVKELFAYKSLAALIFLIDAGRELEFVRRNERYFISRSGSAEYVSLWHDNREYSFGSVPELIGNLSLENETFLMIWSEAEPETLF